MEYLSNLWYIACETKKQEVNGKVAAHFRGPLGDDFHLLLLKDLHSDARSTHGRRRKKIIWRADTRTFGSSAAAMLRGRRPNPFFLSEKENYKGGNNDSEMVRKLKHHEQKLLKKVNLYEWQDSRRGRMWGEDVERRMVQRFRLQKRDSFRSYLMVSVELRRLSDLLRALPEADPVRVEVQTLIMTKLHALGLLRTEQRALVDLGRVHPARFCMRRLCVVLVALKMAPTIDDGITFVEHGHVRVGPQVVLDPDFLVPVAMQDYITWADGSRIREKVARFNESRDDYSLLGN